jgi:hypothetical protein
MSSAGFAVGNGFEGTAECSLHHATPDSELTGLKAVVAGLGWAPQAFVVEI